MQTSLNYDFRYTLNKQPLRFEWVVQPKSFKFHPETNQRSKTQLLSAQTAKIFTGF